MNVKGTVRLSMDARHGTDIHAGSSVLVVDFLVMFLSAVPFALQAYLRKLAVSTSQHIQHMSRTPVEWFEV